MRIGVEDHFDSSHYLPDHDNCSSPHGHTYKVEVVLEGKKQKGMVQDFIAVKAVVQSVLKKYDHVLLNNILKYPSCENISESIYQDLKKKLPLLFSVKVWEGEGKWAEYSE